MSEYFNLINRMREGVLVLTQDLKGAFKIQFSNKSVNKLFHASGELCVADLFTPKFEQSEIL